MFQDTESIYEEIQVALRESGIPHCYHWGKKQPKDNYWVEDCLGADVVAEWNTQSAKLLDSAGRQMFANDWLVSLGLHED